ncbi:MAG: nitrate- and nitrite sensing domain-containing protein [Micromonosporaceae bacterium]|nr:nitrate- and nitrite sensing domain-containing protein [Micromonosporaceae bacterium]
MTHFSATTTRRGWRLPRLRDARIRTKLGLILLTPLLAIAALATARVADGAQRARDAQQVRALSEVSAAASRVSNQIHLERIEAVNLLNTPNADLVPYNARLTATDAAVTAYWEARARLGEPPAGAQETLTRLDRDMNELEQIRQQVLGESPISASAAMLRYGVIMNDVLAFQEAVAEVASDPGLVNQIRAVVALAKAKTLAAEAEANAMVALADGVFTEEELTAFLATQTGQQEAFLEFAKTASVDQQAVVSSVVTGGNVIFADLAISALMRSVGGSLAVAPSTAATSLRGTATATRWAEERLQQMLLVSATELGNAVVRQVIIESAAILVALVLAITVALLLARMLARSLQRLRHDALAVAEHELPDMVSRLSDPSTLGERTPEELAESVGRPAADRSRDEIGQVAQAFTVVHKAAVRVAAEQAVLRTSVSAMFVNLARRSQSLVDRMISQLDEIERNEADPQRLSRMFVLDHLATRMRRNDENLLVLAGVDSSPARTTDALVVDALRAAQSEVEQYDRIEFGLVDTDVAVAAQAVNDVVRLVAELFDNATRFSRPDTSVVCEARRLGDYMIIHIEDRGVGMPADMVERFNERLASPGRVEATTFRQMGLAVVARLASRYQIKVELRSQPGYGTIAYVMLPGSILVMPRARHARPEPARPGPAIVDGRQPAGTYGSVVPAGAVASYGQSGQFVAVGQASGGQTGGVYQAGGTYQSGVYHSAAAQGAPTDAQLAVGSGQGQVAMASADSAQGYSDQTMAQGYGGQPTAQGFSFWSTPTTGDTGATDTGDATAAPSGWQTPADEGWRAAAAAARPQSQGLTRAGLPKRVPQAQLVPGSVSTPAPTPPPRRSPESARGLLTSYQRGVQRGRQGEPR